jgi:hypothetical protein
VLARFTIVAQVSLFSPSSLWLLGQMHTYLHNEYMESRGWCNLRLTERW